MARRGMDERVVNFVGALRHDVGERNLWAAHTTIHGTPFNMASILS